MKRPIRKVASLFILTSIILLGCSEKNPVNLQIKFLNEFKLSEEAQEHLHHMYPTVVDNPYFDEIALSNYISPKNLILVDHTGEFIEKIGTEGRGPGELMSTANFGFDKKGNLVVLDKANSSFKYFNRKKKTISSYEYPINKGIYVTSRELQSCDDKWFMGVQLLGQPSNTDVPIIAVFDSTFIITDSLAGYDPFFKGRSGIFQEPVIKVDCNEKQVFTSHLKTPFIQVFSLPEQNLIHRTLETPASFMLSEKFVSMVTIQKQMVDFTSDEQSMTLFLAFNEEYLFHIFRNDIKNYTNPRNLNDREHFVALYDRNNFNYLGELKLPGAVLGSTKTGSLIILKDETEMIFQLIDIIAIRE